MIFTALLACMYDVNGMKRKMTDLAAEPFIVTQLQRNNELPCSLAALRGRNIYKDNGVLDFCGRGSDEIKEAIEYLRLDKESNSFRFIQEIITPCILTNDAANEMLEFLSNYDNNVGRILLLSDNGILCIDGGESMNPQYMVGAQKLQDGRFDLRFVAKYLYSACISRKVHRDRGKGNAQQVVQYAKDSVFIPHCMEVISHVAQEDVRTAPPLQPPVATDFDYSTYGEIANSADLSNEEVQGDMSSAAYYTYYEESGIDEAAADCLMNMNSDAQSTNNLQFWDIFNSLDFDQIEPVHALSLVSQLRTALCNDQGFLLKLQFMCVDINNLEISDISMWVNVLYQRVANIDPELAEQIYSKLCDVQVKDLYYWIKISHDALLKDLDFQIQHAVFQTENFTDQFAALAFLKALAAQQKN